MAKMLEVTVPDIGDFKDVPATEVLVKIGDTVSKEAPLIVLETDKATMEVPSPVAGVVRALAVKVGECLNKGSAVLTLGIESSGDAASALSTPPAAAASVEKLAAVAALAPPRAGIEAEIAQLAAAAIQDVVVLDAASPPASLSLIPASPALRKLARELDVELARITPTGPRGRLVREDVERFVRSELSQPAPERAAVQNSGSLPGMLPWPRVDFAKFGTIERQPLSRLRKISGANLSRNWVMIPHVTNFDEADITDLEAFRLQVNREQKPDEPIGGSACDDRPGRGTTARFTRSRKKRNRVERWLARDSERLVPVGPISLSN